MKQLLRVSLAHEADAVYFVLFLSYAGDEFMKTRPPITTENQSTMHQVVFLNSHMTASSGRQAKKKKSKQ